MAEEAERRIDRLNVRPRFISNDTIRLNNLFRGQDSYDMLQTVIADDLLGQAAIVSSFGAESAVLLHLVTSIAPHMPVIFVDTGRHFEETLRYRDLLAERLGMTDIRNVTAPEEEIAKRDPNGERQLYDPDGCCELRKVRPLDLALIEFDAIFTGRKAFQSEFRAAIPRFELRGDRMSVNPLASWSREDVDAYFDRHALPRHPLEAEGYPSIGCEPCTTPVVAGEAARSGRWRGSDKTECGIHLLSTAPR